MVVDTTVWVDYLIRKSNDYLIAHPGGEPHAIFYDMPVLHSDKDFTNIAKHTSLKEVQVP